MKDGNQKLFIEVAQKTALMLSDEPYDPSILSVAGMVSLFAGNIQACKMSLAMASTLDPQGHNQQKVLEFISKEEGGAASLSDLMARAKKGRVELIKEAKNAASEHFQKAEYIETDSRLCEALNLQRPFQTMMPALENLQPASEAAQNEVEERARESLKRVDESLSLDSSALETQIPQTQSPQWVNFIKTQMECLESGVVVDFRCLRGSLLKELAQGADHSDQAWRFIGIEPMKSVHLKNEEEAPENFQFYQFDLSELESHLELMPDTIDLAVFPSVLRAFSETQLIQIFSCLKARAKKIIVYDEILNIKGSEPVVRMGAIQHPYQKILSGQGFEVAQVGLIESSEARANGFIMAVNRNQ